MAVYELFVGNIIVFRDNISSNIHGLKVENKLYLVDSFTVNLKYGNVQDLMRLSHHIDLRRSITNLSVMNVLNLEQSITKGPRLNANDFLFLYHTIQVGISVTQISVATYNLLFGPPRTIPYLLYGNFKDNLSLNQIIAVQKSKPISSNLIFNQTIVVKKIQNLIVNSSLVFYDAINFWKPSIDYIHDPNNSEYILSDTKIILYNSVKSIELRNPDWGDVEKIEVSRITRRTRGGNLIVYRKNTWPASRQLSYTFSDLKQDTVSDLLDFIQSTIGKFVNMIDYLGRIWHVIILTPSAEVSEQYRNGFKITLDFQGEVIAP